MATAISDTLRPRPDQRRRSRLARAIARFRTQAGVHRHIAHSIASDALRFYRRDVVIVTLWGRFGVAGQFASILVIRARKRAAQR